MRSSAYETYISSDEWAERRRAYFATHPRQCEKCGFTRKIHLHHLTYVRMGREKDEDLAALCMSCHDELHRLHRRQGGCLRTASELFLGRLQLLAPVQVNRSKKKRRPTTPEPSVRVRLREDDPTKARRRREHEEDQRRLREKVKENRRSIAQQKARQAPPVRRPSKSERQAEDRRRRREALRREDLVTGERKYAHLYE